MKKCGICEKKIDENMDGCVVHDCVVCKDCCMSSCRYKCKTIISLRKQLTELREKLRWIPVDEFIDTPNNNGPFECIVQFTYKDTNESFEVYSLCALQGEADERSEFKILNPDLNEVNDFETHYVTHVREIPELEDGEWVQYQLKQ